MCVCVYFIIIVLLLTLVIAYLADNTSQETDKWFSEQDRFARTRCTILACH
jgi:CHASE1-domain containing sensor protein